MDQAIGDLIGIHHCTAEEAFAILPGAPKTRAGRINPIARDWWNEMIAARFPISRPLPR